MRHFYEAVSAPCHHPSPGDGSTGGGQETPKAMLQLGPIFPLLPSFLPSSLPPDETVSRLEECAGDRMQISPTADSLRQLTIRGIVIILIMNKYQ